MSVIINSIADLKTYEPTSTVTTVYVKAFTVNTNIGGGDFYYDSADTTTVTDNATVIVTNGGKRWKKVISDFNDLNVTHFGALKDGVTDCSAACITMHNWSVKYAPKLGIRFPAGTFKISGIDLSSTSIAHFRMTGSTVAYGYFPATTLISDQGTGMMVKVKARWTEISNLIIYGENDKVVNTKGFYQNTEIEGEFIRITNINFRNLGGVCVSMVDTLDTKIDQFYVTRCTGGVIYGTWSGSATGSWDHLTAVELTNFNIQNCTGANIFDLQRCTQSIIRNGWIEHSDSPGDLSNGQWVIEALSMEDCVNPLNLTFCRYIITQKNLQGTSAILTNDSTKSTWLSIWENGGTEIENYGIRTTGSMNYGQLTSEFRFSNSSASSQWLRLGEVFIPSDGDTLNIRIVGSLGFSSLTNSHDVASGRHGNGEALLRVQKKSPGVQMSWEGRGSCPVTDVMYLPATNKTNCSIYIKLGPYVMNTVAILETSARDRYYAGVCFRWMYDGTKLDETAVTTIEGIVQALPQASWNAGKNGIAIGSDGYFGITTVPIGTDNQLPIYINGSLYKIAVVKQ